jgi:hypothetical protein
MNLQVVQSLSSSYSVNSEYWWHKIDAENVFVRRGIDVGTADPRTAGEV